MTKLKEPEFIRGGFEIPKRGKSSIHINQLADAAMKLRILQRSRKPRMSDVLIRTRLPQAFGSYVKKGKCCTLGVICKKSEAISEYFFEHHKTYNGAPSWSRVVDYFDVTDEELNRMVCCPVKGCFNWDCLLLGMAHLNDTHKWKNSRIGKWLKDYHL